MQPLPGFPAPLLQELGDPTTTPAHLSRFTSFSPSCVLHPFLFSSNFPLFSHFASSWPKGPPVHVAQLLSHFFCKVFWEPYIRDVLGESQDTLPNHMVAEIIEMEWTELDGYSQKRAFYFFFLPMILKPTGLLSLPHLKDCISLGRSLIPSPALPRMCTGFFRTSPVCVFPHSPYSFTHILTKYLLLARYYCSVLELNQ